MERGKTVHLSAYLDVAKGKKISKLNMVPLMVVEVSRGTWAQVWDNFFPNDKI